MGDVCEIRSGGTPSKAKPEFWGGSIPWISPKDMKSRVVSDSIDHITATAVEGGAARVVPLGSVLVVVRSGILARTIPVARTASTLAVNQDIKALIPYATVQPKYLQYFLESVEPSLLKSVTRGATVHRLETPVLQGLPIPVPPLAEQERIVSILDEALAEIDQATQDCSLNLWRAAWLFDSVLAQLLHESEIGDLAALGSVCVTSAGGTPPKSDKQNYAGGTVPWILSGEVNQPEITGATNFISDRGLANSSAKVFPPETVLVAMYGATAGKVSILRIAASTNQAVCGILPNDQYIPEFLVWYLRSKSHEIIAQAQGNAQPNLSQAKIRQTLIPILPIEDQQAIVASVESVLAAVSDYRRRAERKLELLCELRASLLNHAITGQL